MIINKKTTLAEFVFYLDLFNVKEKEVDRLFDRLKRRPIAENLKCSFNDLKFKQLIDLQSGIKTAEDVIFVPLKVVHNIGKDQAILMSAFECLRFALFARDELERIGKMFKEIEYKPSADEERAGVGRLSHGFFGTVDWYARRMGITSHDEVVELNWIVIYQCLKIDFENNRFERRYRDLIAKQSKIKK